VVEVDAVDMDTGRGLFRGRGAGRRAGVPQDHTAGPCRGHHHRGEEDTGAIHHHGEVDVVEVDVEVVEAVEAVEEVVVEVEEARAIAHMAVGVHETVAEVEIADKRRRLQTAPRIDIGQKPRRTSNQLPKGIHQAYFSLPTLRSSSAETPRPPPHPPSPQTRR
jgi:hypothetical protein